ncbi:MAG: hypothetical protein IKZ33_04685, partial [Lentisphaeria bacterium]|nr:hypothetical protein [Lentisphaeria bacterium]
MKTKTAKLVCTLAVCVLVAGTVSARPHHHHHGGGSKDLYRAAAIVDIVANSLVGLSVLAGKPVVATPAVAAPAPVVVAPQPVVAPAPAPVVVAP